VVINLPAEILLCKMLFLVKQLFAAEVSVEQMVSLNIESLFR